MSLKRAETKPASVAPHPARAWSITRRLTLLYVASTTALLLLASGFLYWTLKRNLETASHALLVNKAELLILLLGEPGKAEVLADEVEHEASASHLLKYYIRILDGQGQALLESSRMRELLPVSLFPPPQDSARESRTSLQRDLGPRGSFVLLSVQSRTATRRGEKRILQIAHDISGQVALLADYRRRLLRVLILGVVFAAVAGIWVARKGMRPLIEITKIAEQITANQLHERVAPARWPAELAELAAAFDAMLDRLEQSFTRLSQFSADLAHELRTPINNLRGEVEVALARSRTVEEYQQTLASTLEEYERLSRMIEGLLFLARADNPETAVERVWFDARKEIEAVREFYEALAGEQEVEVACAGQGWLTGDPMLFRRAVCNLVANALEHTPPKQSILLSVQPRDDQAIAVTVRDTGAGIASQHLPKVFDRFYRVDPSHNHSGSRAGLGLAIVQSIMRLHGGAASIQSAVGQGTSITLLFPRSACSSPAGQVTKL